MRQISAGSEWEMLNSIQKTDEFDVCAFSFRLVIYMDAKHLWLTIIGQCQWSWTCLSVCSMRSHLFVRIRNHILLNNIMHILLMQSTVVPHRIVNFTIGVFCFYFLLWFLFFLGSRKQFRWVEYECFSCCFWSSKIYGWTEIKRILSSTKMVFWTSSLVV